MREDFWDRRGANIATRKKGMYSETFRSPKKTRDLRFFATDLSEMGVRNIGTIILIDLLAGLSPMVVKRSFVSFTSY